MKTNQTDEMAAVAPATACYASSSPLLTVKTTPGIPPLDEVEGWDELDRWARCNVGVWAVARKRADGSELMTETDKLRLLAGELLRHNLVLFREACEARMTNPARIIVQHNAIGEARADNASLPQNQTL